MIQRDSHAPLDIHISWKEFSEPRMEPPIQEHKERSARPGAITFTRAVCVHARVWVDV